MVFYRNGEIGTSGGRQLLASGRHEIVSCYTRNMDNAKAFAEEFHCKAYGSAEEAILADGVEGVYVVTPHNAHFRYVKEALELGKPVLCEKAFTVTAEETDSLIALAREKKVYLAEAMWTWFSPAANQVKLWLMEDKLGKVTDANFTYHMKSVKYAPRVSDPKRAGGALLDITIYPITYAYRLWGYPVKIESSGTIENGIDYGEDVMLTFENGLTARISASIVDMKGLEKMTISGEKGKIQAVFYHATIKLLIKRTSFIKKCLRVRDRASILIWMNLTPWQRISGQAGWKVRWCRCRRHPM